MRFFRKVETVKVLKDYDTGRSKGFGFVEMSNNADAQSAINGMNDKEFKGRTLIKINMARLTPKISVVEKDLVAAEEV